MKTYKGVDVFLQTGLVLISIIGAIINNTNLINPLGYIIALGFVQLISIIIHLVAGRLFWKKQLWRKIHHIGTLLVFLLLIIAFILESSVGSVEKDNKYAMPGLELLIYTAVLAILLILFYTIISWVEWRRLKTAS